MKTLLSVIVLLLASNLALNVMALRRESSERVALAEEKKSWRAWLESRDKQIESGLKKAIESAEESTRISQRTDRELALLERNAALSLSYSQKIETRDARLQDIVARYNLEAKLDQIKYRLENPPPR